MPKTLLLSLHARLAHYRTWEACVMLTCVSVSVHLSDIFMTKCSALLPGPERLPPSTSPSSHLFSPASGCPCLTLINSKCKNCLQPPTIDRRWGLGPGPHSPLEVQSSMVYGLALWNRLGLLGNGPGLFRSPVRSEGFPGMPRSYPLFPGSSRGAL